MLTSFIIIFIFLIIFVIFSRKNYLLTHLKININLLNEILSKHFTGRRGAGNGLSGFIMTIIIGKYTKRCHISKYNYF